MCTRNNLAVQTFCEEIPFQATCCASQWRGSSRGEMFDCVMVLLQHASGFRTASPRKHVFDSLLVDAECFPGNYLWRALGIDLSLGICAKLMT